MSWGQFEVEKYPPMSLWFDYLSAIHALPYIFTCLLGQDDVEEVPKVPKQAGGNHGEHWPGSNVNATYYLKYCFVSFSTFGRLAPLAPLAPVMTSLSHQSPSNPSPKL